MSRARPCAWASGASALLLGALAALATLVALATPVTPVTPATPATFAAQWPPLAAAAAASTPAPLPAPTYERVRGIVLSTHGDGADWAGDGVLPSLRSMKQLGASWVAIHPYAGLRADGTVWFEPLSPQSPPASLARPIAEAHAMGMKILIMPHLEPWGTPFRWRGEITFHDPAAWTRFWSGYTQWIESLARACQLADAFCVGSELDGTIEQGAQWRALIQRVRTATAAPLTYASNWNAYERVSFWDALDVIGVEAYFPVLDERSMAQAAHPSAGAPVDLPQGARGVAAMDDAALARALSEGWQALLARLRPYAVAHNRPIVFTELGYNQSFLAPLRPWEYRGDGPVAERVQLACMRAALTAIEGEPWVLGAFLWKWFPEPRPVGRNFQLATPQMMQVIAGAWERSGSANAVTR